HRIVRGTEGARGSHQAIAGRLEDHQQGRPQRFGGGLAALSPSLGDRLPTLPRILRSTSQATADEPRQAQGSARAAPRLRDRAERRASGLAGGGSRLARGSAGKGGGLSPGV